MTTEETLRHAAALTDMEEDAPACARRLFQALALIAKDIADLRADLRIVKLRIARSRG